MKPHVKHPLFIIIITIISIIYSDTSYNGAYAFCGMYVSNKSDETLLNDATQVVLFREGIHTTLTMRNSYKGPVEDFAMLVPVPQVLDEHMVETVDPVFFDALSLYTIPRFVQYSETYYCRHVGQGKVHLKSSTSKSKFYDFDDMAIDGEMLNTRVNVVKEMEKGEYEIKILEAKDSSVRLTVWRCKIYSRIFAGRSHAKNLYSP